MTTQQQLMVSLWRRFGAVVLKQVEGVKDREDQMAVLVCMKDAEQAIERVMCAVARVTR